MLWERFISNVGQVFTKEARLILHTDDRGRVHLVTWRLFPKLAGYFPFFFDQFLVESLSLKCCLFDQHFLASFSGHYRCSSSSTSDTSTLDSSPLGSEVARLLEALAISVSESCSGE